MSSPYMLLQVCIKFHDSTPLLLWRKPKNCRVRLRLMSRQAMCRLKNNNNNRRNLPSECNIHLHHMSAIIVRIHKESQKGTPSSYADLIGLQRKAEFGREDREQCLMAKNQTIAQCAAKEYATVPQKKQNRVTVTESLCRMPHATNSVRLFPFGVVTGDVLWMQWANSSARQDCWTNENWWIRLSRKHNTTTYYLTLMEISGFVEKE